MLYFVLVLFFAGTALAAPYVDVTQYNINDVAPVPDNGRYISSYLTNRAAEIHDDGDTNIYMLTIQQIVDDLANQPDNFSQTLAVIQAIAGFGEVATGIPGDSCEAAALINAYADYLRTGNPGPVYPALRTYINRLTTSIDLIVQLANNPSAARLARGPTGNCVGGGRSYQFEAAWQAVVASAGPNRPLVDEEYCATKRLYTAFSSASNNVGAAITAASIAPVTQTAQQALPSLAAFLRAIANGSNPAAAAAQAKAALLRSVGNVQL